ncbi:MAG: polysaccharide biosynthesis tyrosine autokinase [Bacillota bacterium]|nr:polysaccharide biosynthesis tyrosine autokinase [Bacillota bacterium]
MKSQSSKEITFSDVFYWALRWKWIVLVSLITAVGGSFIYTKSTYTTSYTATASMVVNIEQDPTLTMQPTAADIYLAQNLSDTYALILKSNRVISYVKDKLNLDMPLSELRSYIKLTTTKNTQILYVNVTCSDPQLAVKIANKVMEVAPKAMMETVEIGTINVLDYATLPTAPEPPKISINIIFGALIGIGAGIVITLLLGILSARFRSSEEVEDALIIPTLGEIPHIGKKEKSNGSLLSSESVPINYSEAFRMIGTVVQFVAGNAGLKTLAVTSSTENEGKTLLSVNIALALVQAGKKVLLIDSDIVNPSVNKLLKIPEEQVSYFSQALKESLSSCIVNLSSGLSVIPFIKDRERDHALFSSPLFYKAIDGLKTIYDYIIFDTAPVSAVTDAIALAGRTDGVILIVRQEHASQSTVSAAVAQLRLVKANIIGCVLNDIRYRKPGSGYSDKYRYYNYENNAHRESRRNEGEVTADGNKEIQTP